MATSPTTVPTTSCPILDRVEPLPPLAKPERGISVFLFLATFALTTTVLIWSPPVIQPIEAWIDPKFAGMYPGSSTPFEPLVDIFVLIFGFLLCAAIHETAHLLAGLWGGFTFNSLRVSVLQIDRPFRVSICRDKGAAGSGWTSMFPVKKDRLAQRAMLMIFAGPAANLLTGFIVLFLPYSKGSLSFAFVTLSLFLGFANLLPFRSRFFSSDGMRIFMLLQNRARGERWVALMKLGTELVEGVEPENLSPDFLSKAIALQDKSGDTVHAFALAFTSAVYKGEMTKAAEYLETSLRYSAHSTPLMRQALMCDAGVFQARRRNRADLASQWLADLPTKTLLPWTRLEVEAAILEAQGDFHGALSKLDDVEKLNLATKNQALRELQKRFTLRWMSELQEKIPDSGSKRT